MRRGPAQDQQDREGGEETEEQPEDDFDAHGCHSVVVVEKETIVRA
jgi:hypothetical protein